MITDAARGGMGDPLVNVAHRLIFHKVPRIYQKKNQHEQVGTQNRAAQLSRARRGQRHRWIGHSTLRRNSNPLNTSRNQKREMREKKGPTPKKKRKAMTLTSHAAAMDLVVEFPGNRVVPRQRFGPIPQFLVGAASEEGAQTIAS